MHRTIAVAGTGVFALVFAVLALMFGYYQGDLLEVLRGAKTFSIQTIVDNDRMSSFHFSAFCTIWVFSCL